MKEKIDAIVESALKKIGEANTEKDIGEIRVSYLGRKRGLLTALTRQIPTLPKEEKVGIGTKIRQSHKKIDELLNQKLISVQPETKTAKEDLSVKGQKLRVGSLHPLTQVTEDVLEIFHYLGFGWTDGPEVESTSYNFQKLNIPSEHPSRDLQQTFYISENAVLRTHTSSMQVRFMEKTKPPIRILFPGRAYRIDMPDSTHLPAFFQIEGLMVDDKLSMTNLLGTLEYFAKSFFGEKAKIRVYGHNFPYTEPSIEVEVFHPKKGWLEILGTGMVHPNVLKEAGLDPDKYRGWAFGVGVERLAMLKYEIDDVRDFVTNDIRFLDQF